MAELTTKKSIDLSEYFLKYNIINPSIQPPQIDLTQGYNYARVSDKMDITEYTDDYTLSDVDKPDTLSLKLYDFPLPATSINSLSNYLFQTVGDYSLSTYSKFIENINDSKRKIKIIKKDKLQNFLKDFGDLINV